MPLSRLLFLLNLYAYKVHHNLIVSLVFLFLILFLQNNITFKSLIIYIFINLQDEQLQEYKKDLENDFVNTLFNNELMLKEHIFFNK